MRAIAHREFSPAMDFRNLLDGIAHWKNLSFDKTGLNICSERNFLHQLSGHILSTYGQTLGKSGRRTDPKPAPRGAFSWHLLPIFPLEGD